MTARHILAILLACWSAVSGATEVRIPALAEARASVQLVDSATRKPVLGFYGEEWATAHVSVALDMAQLVDLTPTGYIATVGARATCYLVTAQASGGRGWSQCVQVPASDQLQELRDLVGAAAIDPTDITAGLVLTSDERAALDAANDPDGDNPLATMADIPASLPESDPAFTASAAAGISVQDIADWGTAYGWGDHAGLYDPTGSGAAAVAGHEGAYAHDLIGSAVQPGDDVTVMGSGATTSGYAPLADGAGGVVWTQVAAEESDPVATALLPGYLDKSTYDPAAIGQQVAGTTATQTLTNKTLNSNTNYIDGNALHTWATNDSGGARTVGKAVRIKEWAGTYPSFECAQATSAAPVLGLVEEASIADGASGSIRTHGELTGADTSAWSDGDVLYLSAATPCALTTTAPTGAGVYQCKVGMVARQHATAGVIEVLNETCVPPLATVATSGAAADVANTPAGDIAATNVQGAINELDSEKLAPGGIKTVFAFGWGWDSTKLSTGTARWSGRVPMPDGMTVTGVSCNLVTAATGSAVQIDINASGSSILSTPITIDATELTSQTAATPPVISHTGLDFDELVTMDIDQIGATTPGEGLKCLVIGVIPQ